MPSPIWLALAVCALSVAHAQDALLGFEVFSSPKADCITATPGTVSVSFASAFPGIRQPRLFYSYAGSMPGAAALAACQQMSGKQTVVLSPTFEGEAQGNLRVLAMAGNCSSPTARAPLQFAVQLVGSQGAEDLGLISCPNPSVCHLYYVSPTRPVSEVKAGCVYCGNICRVVVKKGVLLSTVSDDNKGPCCDGCSCKYSHYVQTGKFINRVRTYYYICKDPTCFPADATVEVAGQGKQPLSALRVGDAVLTVNAKSGKPQYSEVYALPHRVLSSSTAYLQISDAHNRTLTVSAGHLVHASTRASTRLSDYVARPASQLRVGQYVWSSDGAGGFGPACVERVLHTLGSGMVAPFTMEGSLLVDGVLASSYATHGALSATTAHAALAPLRWAWRVCPAALHTLHRAHEGDSPALLSAGLRILDVAERVQSLSAAV